MAIFTEIIQDDSATCALSFSRRTRADFVFAKISAATTLRSLIRVSRVSELQIKILSKILSNS